MKIIIKTFVLFLFISVILTAQSTRGLVNDGVDEYEKNKFPEAEVNFKKGIEKDVESFESRFNLGDAIYKQGRYEEALEEFKNSMPLAVSENEKASIFHNIGNTFLKSKKLKESIGAYREALKINPDDMETKYNLSYALKQMQNQQKNNQNQQNKDNKDKNNKNKDKKDQDKNKQDQNKNDNKKEQDKQQQNQNKNKEENQQQQPQEPKDEISKDEAQRILDALKNNEGELQKKMRKQKAKKTNVEKDW